MTDFRYPHRIASLRERLTESSETSPAIEALIVSHLDNCRYLSGFTGSNALVIVTPTEALFLTDGRYTLQAGKEVPGFEIIILPQGTNLARAASEEIRKRGIKTVGFEETNLTVSAFTALRSALNGENGEGMDIQLIGKTGMVESVRAIKDADEITKLRAAIKLGDECFSYLLTIIKPGMTEREIAWKLEVYAREHGATRMSFDSIVGSGANSALIHGRPSDYVLGSSGKPELLLLDFGVELNGYCSDMTRTLVIGGEPTDEQRKMYNSVLKAQNDVIDAIKPGEIGKEIHDIAVKDLTADGYGEYFEHGTGHQLGRVVHDGPAFSVVADVAMKPGMVVTVEPGSYIENFGGVRIEDVILVTEAGHENLTKSSKQLFVK